MCTRIFSLSMKQKLSFVFLWQNQNKRNEKREKNLTPKMLNVDSQKRKSSCKQSFLETKVSFFNKRVYSPSLTKLSWKKFPLSSQPKRKSNAGGTTQLCVIQRKEHKNKNTWLSSLFSCFSLNKKIFVKHSPKTEPTEFFVGAACQMRRFNLT